MKKGKTSGTPYKCGNCGTTDNCSYRWVYDTDYDGNDVCYKLYLCADCEAIVGDDDGWTDGGDDDDDGRVCCGNCGEWVYPDEDDDCPECGCNVYMM